MGLEVTTATSTVTTKDANGHEETTTTSGGYFPSEVPPARVRVSLSFTKNLGNYQSARAEVSLDMPCAPDGSSITECFETTQEWVDDKLSTIVKDMG